MLLTRNEFSKIRCFELPKATTEYDFYIVHSDIVIYFHLRNLVVIQLQRQLSKMKIDFALEP